MKKYLPYLLLGLLAVLLLILVLKPSSRSKERDIDFRSTFKKNDKIPYGTYIAWENLRTIFPHSRITTESGAPGFWTSLSETARDQLLIIISPQFKPEDTEMETLLNFVRNGNDVFISTMSTSFYLEKALKCDVFYAVNADRYSTLMSDPDSMTVSLTIPAGENPRSYTYPGHSMGLWFHSYDSAKAVSLGVNKRGKTDFIGMRKGQGHLYLHLAPMAFTNYFLLHKQNMAYYDQVFSMMGRNAKTVVWDEYFLNHREEQGDMTPPEPRGWLATLMSMENRDGKRPFRAAFWVLMALLAIYGLSEMRRKQRVIPPYKKPANASLDFVKTIGRLYFGKGDHRNLSRKMTAYFLEHVRSRYKISTQMLNDQFVNELSFKSGIDEKLIQDIVNSIHQLQGDVNVSAQAMAYHHDLLEKFYNQS